LLIAIPPLVHPPAVKRAGHEQSDF
jgi:hypothetical protein